MILKQVKKGEEAKRELKEGITILSDAVKSTLGPRGGTVIIEAEDRIGGMTTTKDGVTVASYVNLPGATQNAAVMIMREAARGTVEEAGDGTTTSIVLAEALINQFDEKVESIHNKTEVIRYIKSFAEQIVSRLDEVSQKVEGSTLLDVATISANNDPELGKLISDAFISVSGDGVVNAQDGQGRDTTVELSEGITFDRGFTSPFQLTNREKNIIELKNPFVLISDREVEDISQLYGILEPIIKMNRSFLIIGSMSLKAQAAFNKNVLDGHLKGAFVLAPGFGLSKSEMLEDLASALGGEYISEQTGDNWETITLDNLGVAESVRINRSYTIIQDMPGNSDRKEERISDLRKQQENAKDQGRKEDLQNRIANLCGKVATIVVGGKTSMEQKERRDRVDDAILATKAALEGGILPGGGIALLNQVWGAIVSNPKNKNEFVAELIIKDALREPFNQIVRNAGLSPKDIIDNDLFDPTKGNGYNVKTEEYGNMKKMGVIDPTKVTKSALMNAVSVASTISGSPVVITNVRDYGEK